MNAIDTAFDAYKKVSQTHGLPALESRAVTSEAQTFSDEGAVRKKIEEFAPAEGWVRYQSELVAVQEGAWKPQGAKSGRLLYGELANGPRSLTIRPFGDRWRVITVTEGAGGQQYLAEDVAFLRDNPGINGNAASSDDKSALRYVVYWTVDDGGSRPALSRFTGFGKPKG